ncbi:phosphatase 2C-like domain-containing protein [Paraphysoderma sedebokerense]|nr:phosphatase 2C-like domain-containing protein [Paraphysoderma sedebokerense]KAI9140408.1 phosphatase 2C-like domain-containing protein [Paraphysoderma sedebokerense]
MQPNSNNFIFLFLFLAVCSTSNAGILSCFGSKQCPSSYGLHGSVYCAAKNPSSEGDNPGNIQQARDCGEDAFFEYKNEKEENQSYKSLGVADGVGSFSADGIDPRYFAWNLMNNCQDAARTASSPREILSNAFESLMSNPNRPHGACTATVLNFDERFGRLTSANLGDSGYWIIRKSEVFFKSKEMQHRWNMPYQLHHDRSLSNIPLTEAVQQSHNLQDGDVIIVATDGLFDNLFQADILNIVNPRVTDINRRYKKSKSIATVGVGMSQLSKSLVLEARVCMNMDARWSPFSLEARNHGDHAGGGKVDDITVFALMVKANFD